MALIPESTLPATLASFCAIGKSGRKLTLNPECAFSIEQFIPIATEVINAYSGPVSWTRLELAEEVGKKWYFDYISHVAEFKGFLNSVPQILQNDYWYTVEKVRTTLKLLGGARVSIDYMETGGAAGANSDGSLPTTLELVLDGSHAGVPNRAQWTPFGCALPFHMFQNHIKRTMQKKLEWNERMMSLPMELLKLRYAEYMAHVLQPSDPEFMLGVVSAFGHQVNSYPLRVIDLMKGRGLLRSGTRFFDIVTKDYCTRVPGKSYSRVNDFQYWKKIGKSRLPRSASPCSSDRTRSQDERSNRGSLENSDYNRRKSESSSDGYKTKLEQDAKNKEPALKISASKRPLVPPPPPDLGCIKRRREQSSSSSSSRSSYSSSAYESSIPTRPGPRTSLDSHFEIPFQVWKLMCEKTRAEIYPRAVEDDDDRDEKREAKLSDADYKLWYARYIYHVIDNYREFLEGIITGFPAKDYPQEVRDMITHRQLIDEGKLPPIIPHTRNFGFKFTPGPGRQATGSSEAVSLNTTLNSTLNDSYSVATRSDLELEDDCIIIEYGHGQDKPQSPSTSSNVIDYGHGQLNLNNNASPPSNVIDYGHGLLDPNPNGSSSASNNEQDKVIPVAGIQPVDQEKTAEETNTFINKKIVISLD